LNENISLVGGASVAAGLNLLELFENGKIWAKHENKPIIGSQGQAFKLE
jgi:hypothetical protein